MKLNAPTKLFFLISLILVVVALLGGLGVVGAIAGYSFWIAIAAWVVLALGCILKGA
tara:strand:- start:7686 stop:7856 length:171 start_codon:yes stop_codon:yes gene_type:complete